MRGMVVGVAGMAAAVVAAPAGAVPLPPEDRAVLSSSVVSSAAAPYVLVPGGRVTVVVSNIGRTPTKPLRVTLVEAPGAAFGVEADRCSRRVLKPRQRCRVTVGYAGEVAPEADATARLRVAARGTKRLETTTYFTVAARPL